MPFDTLYLDSTNPKSAFMKELRRNLEMNKVQLVDSPEKADVVLDIVSELPDKQILSLGGNGSVNEYKLFYRISLRAYDLMKRDWIPAEEFVMHRNLPNDDNNVIAIDFEESLLYQSMRKEMVQQIVRRLSRSRPEPQ
jgi:LPS-assembly lipoprotein